MKMKGVLLLICAVVAHIHAQSKNGCGCVRPLPLCPHPPPPPRPKSPCPRPTPCPPPCPPPVPTCPRPLPPIPLPRPQPPSFRPCEIPPPVIEVCDYNQAVVPLIQAPLLQPPLQGPVFQQPLVSYDVAPCTALPSCNCPAPPSLPVSQLYPFSPVIPPYVLNSGLSISPCLGGLAELSPVFSPVGLINPFLPAASPISALAPTVSSLYPPINPCGCGCHFLKKIPIPPPCI